VSIANTTSARVDRIKEAFGPVVTTWTPANGRIELDWGSFAESVADKFDALRNQHDARVTELLESNNRLLERARKAEGALLEAESALLLHETGETED
jgi:hypothetical protein